MSSIQDIKLLDIEKRRVPSKHYAYIMEVSWSDGSHAKIGRSYSELFDFQMTLLENFPSEAGQHDPTKRIIPFLPGKSLFRRENTRESALKRMGPIDEYCTGIAKMPSSLIRSSIVENFFQKNSDDDRINLAKSPSIEESGGNVQKANEITGPLVLDKYIAIADYKKENKKELSLTSGQVVEVVEKSDNGWWLAANEDGMNGWVPATYLEALYGTSTEEYKRVKRGEGELFEGVTSFTSDSSDELAFEVGDVLEILEKSLEGWWYAIKETNEGWVPATYLQKSSQSRSNAGFSEKNVLPDVQSKRPSYQDNKKPPPKRSTVRRTLTKATAAQVKVDFRAKYLKKFEAMSFESLEEDDVELNETFVTTDDFDASNPDSLSFGKNETVHVLRKSNAGWWYGRIGNKKGWIPESYLSKKNSTPSRQVPQIPAPPKPTSSPTSKPQKPLRPQSPVILPKTGGNVGGANKIKDLRRLANQLPLPPAGKQSGSPSAPTQISKDIDLTDYDWYRDVSRKEAEEALTLEGQEGFFIIRPSVRGAKKEKPYSLTLHHQHTNWNFHIRRRQDSKYAVGIYKEFESCFNTLPELVNHYNKTPLILGEDERKVLLTGSPQDLYDTC